ncbi:MAG: hypothetical protein K6G88_11675 [Lachnospiraceae bacterium]|nr:hypothetical protein [Lachnospiraceae bacterium]
MIYKDRKTGEKLYPVCSFNDNQHKLYNVYDMVMGDLYENKDPDMEDELYEKRERIENALEVFGANVIDGIVYATYKDSVIIKDYIAAYNLRH